MVVYLGGDRPIGGFISVGLKLKLSYLSNINAEMQMKLFKKYIDFFFFLSKTFTGRIENVFCKIYFSVTVYIHYYSIVVSDIQQSD